MQESNIKISTQEDKPTVLSMINKRVEELFDEFIVADLREKVIIQHADTGVFVGAVFKTPTGKMATDVLWWVDKEHRKNGIGSKLLDAFEAWAENVGADFVAMTSLHADIGKEYFESKRYVLQGMAWIKFLGRHNGN